jgi:purine-binding chemotaxis protein CheW
MNSDNSQSHPQSKAGADDRASSQFVGFHVAEQEYAFPIEQIREVVIPKAVTPLPQVPACVEGVTNLRGTIIPVVSLRTLFGLERRPTDPATRTIVVQVGDRIMGCLVDDVTQVIRLDSNHIQPPSELATSAQAGFITGFAKIDQRILVILSINELMDPETLHRVQHVAAPETDPLKP